MPVLLARGYWMLIGALQSDGVANFRNPCDLFLTCFYPVFDLFLFCFFDCRFLGARGLAVAALYPAFNGVTIAGAVGTGAHGSSLVFPSALGSAVVAAELVNSDGDLVNITAGDELAAVQCHLGVLGVVTRMRLAVVLQFKVRVVQTVEPEALLTNGTFLDICKSQLWVYLGYYPHLKKAVLRVGEKVTVSTIVGQTSIRVWTFSHVLLSPMPPPPHAPCDGRVLQRRYLRSAHAYWGLMLVLAIRSDAQFTCTASNY